MNITPKQEEEILSQSRKILNRIMKKYQLDFYEKITCVHSNRIDIDCPLYEPPDNLKKLGIYYTINEQPSFQFYRILKLIENKLNEINVWMNAIKPGTIISMLRKENQEMERKIMFKTGPYLEYLIKHKAGINEIERSNFLDSAKIQSFALWKFESLIEFNNYFIANFLQTRKSTNPKSVPNC
jgi:hypothetical protein